VAVSVSTDQDDDIIEILQDYTVRFIDRWLRWLDSPELVPEEQQAEQQKYDHTIRELGYSLDPMNQHFVPAFGEGEVKRMVNIRMGREQMNEARRY
jgi:hypothetical protein